MVVWSVALCVFVLFSSVKIRKKYRTPWFWNAIFCMSRCCVYLEDALCHHGLCYFHEACNVGSLDVVDVAVGFGAVLDAVLMDILHNPKELGVDFLCLP